MDDLRVAFGDGVRLDSRTDIGRRALTARGSSMHRLPLDVGVVFSMSLPAFARSTSERASVGDDITISDGETAGDVACAFCSVHVHGEVKGDVAVLFGAITVDAGKSIGGDVAAP